MAGCIAVRVVVGWKYPALYGERWPLVTAQVAKKRGLHDVGTIFGVYTYLDLDVECPDLLNDYGCRDINAELPDLMFVDVCRDDVWNFLKRVWAPANLELCILSGRSGVSMM